MPPLIFTLWQTRLKSCLCSRKPTCLATTARNIPPTRAIARVSAAACTVCRAGFGKAWLSTLKIGGWGGKLHHERRTRPPAAIPPFWAPTCVYARHRSYITALSNISLSSFPLYSFFRPDTTFSSPLYHPLGHVNLNPQAQTLNTLNSGHKMNKGVEIGRFWIG